LIQIMTLLLHHDETERRLVPQLREIAAWLAAMRPDVFREIIKIEPEVLLRSDLAAVGEKDRATFVETILALSGAFSKFVVK